MGGQCNCICGSDPFRNSRTDVDISTFLRHSSIKTQNSVFRHDNTVGKYPVTLDMKFTRTNDENGFVYTGNIVLNGVKHGKGTLFNPTTGEKYSGDFVQNYRDGVGFYQCEGFGKYKGEWKDDMPHGEGIREYPDGKVYSGEWVEGIR